VAVDKIGDFLTKIRNAGSAKHDKVDMPSSRLRSGLAKILEEQGYIRSFRVAKDGKQGLMRVYLRYDETGKHVINAISRISRPGRRVYVGARDIPEVRSGFGIAILSTNKGIMSSQEAAEQNLGGELLLRVW
jgi:small subunit ribosomal protein S8